MFAVLTLVPIAFTGLLVHLEQWDQRTHRRRKGRPVRDNLAPIPGRRWRARIVPHKTRGWSVRIEAFTPGEALPVKGEGADGWRHHTALLITAPWWRGRERAEKWGRRQVARNTAIDARGRRAETTIYPAGSADARNQAFDQVGQLLDQAGYEPPATPPVCPYGCDRRPEWINENTWIHPADR